MKIKSILSMAFGAVLMIGLAAPAMAQDTTEAVSSLTMEALSSQPGESVTPENIDGSRVNPKVQKEVRDILADYNRKSSGNGREARVDALNRLDRLYRTDEKNLSLRMVMGYLSLTNGEPKRAIEVLEACEGKSKFEVNNRQILQNLALAYYLTQQYEDAADSYDRLNEIGGALNSGMLRFAGSSSLLCKRHEKAVFFLEKAKTSFNGTEKTALLRDLASAYIGCNRTGDALTTYEELVQGGDLAPETLSWMGYSYVREKRYSEAIKVLVQAREKKANDAAILGNLGNAYMGAGDNEKAREVYTHLCKVDSTNYVAPYNLGVLCMKDGQYQEAAEAFKKSCSMSGSRSESRYSWNNLGFCYEKLGKHAESASAYAKASDLDASSGIFARNAGMAYTRCHDSANARKYLDRAKALGASGAAGDSNLVESMIKEGRTKEAIAALRQMADANPTNADLWFNIGVLCHKSGDKDEAAEAYKKALDIKPDDADSLRNYGLLLIETGRSSQAISVLEKMVGAYPSSVEGRMALASAYVKSDRLRDAVAVYREVVRIEPSRNDARLNLADGLWNLGQTKDARFQYSSVLRSQPSNARALNGMGLWHLLQSDAKSAEKVFRSSISSDAGYLPAYNNLAIALERLNRKAEAILILRRALQRDPNFRDARTNLDRLENSANIQR